MLQRALQAGDAYNERAGADANSRGYLREALRAAIEGIRNA